MKKSPQTAVGRDFTLGPGPKFDIVFVRSALITWVGSADKPLLSSSWTILCLSGTANSDKWTLDLCRFHQNNKIWNSRWVSICPRRNHPTYMLKSKWVTKCAYTLLQKCKHAHTNHVLHLLRRRVSVSADRARCCTRIFSLMYSAKKKKEGFRTKEKVHVI